MRMRKCNILKLFIYFMDDALRDILTQIGIEIHQGNLIDRNTLISDTKYEEIKPNIQNIKQYYSSSYLTSLQTNADKKQKWPLLNFLRQILKIRGVTLTPIRKANGYTKEGKKLYKRFFLIEKIKKEL